MTIENRRSACRLRTFCCKKLSLQRDESRKVVLGMKSCVHGNRHSLSKLVYTVGGLAELLAGDAGRKLQFLRFLMRRQTRPNPRSVVTSSRKSINFMLL